jgi:hypothetical protein
MHADAKLNFSYLILLIKKNIVYIQYFYYALVLISLYVIPDRLLPQK